MGGTWHTPSRLLTGRIVKKMEHALCSLIGTILLTLALPLAVTAQEATRLSLSATGGIIAPRLHPMGEVSLRGSSTLFSPRLQVGYHLSYQDGKQTGDEMRATWATGLPGRYIGNYQLRQTVSRREIHYLIIDSPGASLRADVEHNGLTLNGVGSGTEIDHVAILSSGDDGLECFGETVSPHTILVRGAEDDLIDLTDGYRGTISRLYGIYSSESRERGEENLCLIEVGQSGWVLPRCQRDNLSHNH